MRQSTWCGSRCVGVENGGEQGVSGVIQTILAADAQTTVFQHRDGPVAAGDIRRAAYRLAASLTDESRPVFLHTRSASLFVVGLMGAAFAGREVVLPAHAEPSYLRELGGDERRLLSDAALRPLLEASDDVSAPAGAPTDVRLTFFTSGSTAKPTPIPKVLSQLEQEARYLDATWPLRSGGVHATVSHQHFYGLLFRVVWPILAGRSSSDEAAEYWEAVARQARPGDWLVTSPAHLSRLPDGIDFAALALGRIFSSGQLLREPDALRWRAASGRSATEVYGSTETGGIAWREQEVGNEAWTPLAQVSIARLDDGFLEVASPWSGGRCRTGDLVDLAGDGRFALMGRGDRVVKVEGKRVSLSRVEAALQDLPEISDAAVVELPDRRGALGAVVALTPEGRGQLTALGPFRLSRKIRRSLEGRLEPAESPKHWRFEPSIPVNTQGKRVLANLQALFAGPSSLRYEVLRAEAMEAELKIVLQPELAWFQGHFPDKPILPGIAQVHMAAQIARELWAIEPNTGELSRVKFRSILQPGDLVKLTLSRTEEGRVTFAFNVGEIEASCGAIGH